ncbi:MAG: TRAP transporter substrate-binding protein DctP [Betaproteobacteria bacterium]
MSTTSNPILATAAAAALLTASHAALAQDKVSLRAADYLAPTHYLIRYGVTHWIEQVTKQSNGRIEIKHFPSEQLGKAKDMLSLTQSGVADVAGIVPSFVSDRMPLSTIAELPGLYNTSCQGTRATADLMMNDGILVKQELEPNNVIVIFTLATPTYTAFSKREKLSSIDDLKGQKLRTVGGVMSQTLDKLGAVGVQMASPEIYESLARGTVEGLVYAYSPLFSGGLQKLVKSSIADVNFGGASYSYVMNKQKFSALPADVQKILLSAGQDTMAYACREADRETREAKEKVAASGVQSFPVPAAEKLRWNKVFDDVADEWVKDGAKRGKPAGAVYKAYREALAKYPD